MLSKFAQWLSLTREHVLTGPEQIVNDAVKNTYIIGECIRAKSEKLIRGGNQITERIKLLDTGSFRTYSPGTERNPQRRNTTRTVRIPWRFSESDISYTDAEIELNEGDDELSKFKSFRFALEQDEITDHWNGMENALWRRPSEADMEVSSATPGLQYSIPALISENPTTFRPPGWSGTIMQLDPTVEDGWRNALSRYNPANLDGPHDGLFAAFDDICLKLHFISPPGYDKYMEQDDLRSMKFVTNRNGRNLYSQLLRDGQDNYRAGPQDPSYGMPVFKGIPIWYCSDLDTSLLDEVGGAYTNQPYPDGRPRFFALNLRFAFPVFHKKRMFMPRGPIHGGVKMPDTETLFRVSWWNFVVASRKRNGIIAPI